MDVGSSLAVFLVLALILLALFCLLTKYFHHKMNQNIEEAAQIYSMVQEVGVQDMDSQQYGNYDQFKGPDLQKMIKGDNRNNPGYQEIQMAEMFMRTPMNNSNEDIYAPHVLKQKLNSNMIPRNMETGRSMSSLRQFKPDKLIATNRTNRSNKDTDEAKRGLIDKNYPKSDYEDPNYHTFVNKMVCYDSQGITVVEVDVLSIRKLGERAFKENRIVRSYLTTNHEKGFDDQLEIFGFEKGDYGCFKYLTKVQTQNMKINEQYAIKSLKTCEEKQSMEVQDYLKVKIQLQNNS